MTATPNPRYRGIVAGALWFLLQGALLVTRLGRVDRGSIAVAVVLLWGGLSLTPLVVTLASNAEARQTLQREFTERLGRLWGLVGLALLLLSIAVSVTLGQYLIEGDSRIQQILGAIWLALFGIGYAALAVLGYAWLKGRMSALGK